MTTRSRARRRLCIAAATVAALAALAPAAQASITPTMKLDQSAGDVAGASANLGLNLSFAPSSTSDSPKNLTLELPPGLLADASIDGGACLTTADTSGTTCQVGSGTVTASPDLLVPVPSSLPVTFYLVPPPGPGDLAGLAVIGLGQQLGQTGAIRVRPTGSPDGVGVEIALVLPQTLPIAGVPISVESISSTFDSLRYPATCPSPAADMTATVDSYSDPTVHRLSAPLAVAGCGKLAFAPAFRVIAARDASDHQVNVSTYVTAPDGQAPSGSVTLSLPVATLSPNLASIRALCVNASLSGCQQVGSATATSPLYPRPLTGNAYLTGSPQGLALTLQFPSPFPLTLTGQVNLVTNSATFTGLPDIPLSSLAVSLSGGAEGLYQATCQTPSGTASATLTDVNGDRAVTDRAQFTVSGCSSVTGAAGSGASGSGGSGGSGASGGSQAGSPHGSSARTARRPRLRFRVSARRHRRIARMTLQLPRGLSFKGYRLDKRRRVLGLSLPGARLRAQWLSHGRLIIVLRRPARSIMVTLGSIALRESRALSARAASGKIGRVTVTVVVGVWHGSRAVVRVRLAHPHL